MASVEEVTKSRIENLRKGHPYLTFEDDYMDTEVGMRGLIRIFGSGGEVEGLEFIEGEEFWMDPDAVEEYRETLEEGYRVTVIVPSEEKEDAKALLREEVSPKITVLGYEDVRTPLAS